MSAPRARRPAREAGIALISALVVTTVVVSVALTAAALQRHEITQFASLIDVDAAMRVATELEGRALEVLLDDRRLGGHDAPDEAWSSVEIAATGIRAHGHARLSELQGRLNLNNLVADPAFTTRAARRALPPSPFMARRREAETRGMSSAGGSPAAQRGTQGWRGIGSAGTGFGAEPASGAGNAAPGNTGEPMNDDAPVGDIASVTTEIGCTGGDCGPFERASDTAPAASEAPAWEIAMQQLRRLFETLDIETNLVPALADWLDGDSDARYPNGAEDAYYLGLERPYRAGNRPLASVSELHLVRGFTPEIVARLAPFVTALPDHVPVNVNTAQPEVLMSLSPLIDRAFAARLVEVRGVQPFLSREAFMLHPALAGRDLTGLDAGVSSTYFELRSVLKTGTATLETRTLIHRASAASAAAIRRERGPGG